VTSYKVIISHYSPGRNESTKRLRLQHRFLFVYEGVSKSSRTGRLERELQMVQLSATRCSYIAILWASLSSFAAITICVASQRVIPKVSVYFVIDSVRKPWGTPSYLVFPFIWLVGY
jgi:hypothetical protein